MWNKKKDYEFVPAKKIPHINSGYIEGDNVVFVELETHDLRYYWTNNVELVDGIDIRIQLVNAEIDLWTSLAKRLKRLSNFE